MTSDKFERTLQSILSNIKEIDDQRDKLNEEIEAAITLQKQERQRILEAWTSAIIALKSQCAIATEQLSSADIVVQVVTEEEKSGELSACLITYARRGVRSRLNVRLGLKIDGEVDLAGNGRHEAFFLPVPPSVWRIDSDYCAELLSSFLEVVVKD